MPVCDINNNNHRNPCEARAAGAVILHVGQCGSCPNGFCNNFVFPQTAVRFW